MHQKSDQSTPLTLKQPSSKVRIWSVQYSWGHPEKAKTNKIWQLQKCVYGLADASQYWYLIIWEELCKLGGRPSNRREMTSIVSLFVDDLLWEGNSELLQIMQKLKIIFQVASENLKSVTYVGINTKQNDDFSITVDQHANAETIQPVPVTREKSVIPTEMLLIRNNQP